MIPATDIPAITDLIRRRLQLTSRIEKISGVTSLGAMADLLSGTGLEDSVLNLSKMQVAQYLADRKAEIETQLSELGVDLNA